jgi:hypothetical protein
MLTYAAARQLVQTFVDDLAKVEATLGEVKDAAVKLPLHVGLIKIDPFGQGKPINAAFLLERIEGMPATSQQAQDLVIGFDRGDVSFGHADDAQQVASALAAGGHSVRAVLGLAVGNSRRLDGCAAFGRRQNHLRPVRGH